MLNTNFIESDYRIINGRYLCLLLCHDATHDSYYKNYDHFHLFHIQLLNYLLMKCLYFMKQLKKFLHFIKQLMKCLYFMSQSIAKNNFLQF